LLANLVKKELCRKLYFQHAKVPHMFPFELSLSSTHHNSEPWQLILLNLLIYF
jgi:hypothetical protein